MFWHMENLLLTRRKNWSDESRIGPGSINTSAKSPRQRAAFGDLPEPSVISISSRRLVSWSSSRLSCL